MDIVNTMDWNWFFSALAQSVAALVAILGGFIFNRLLNDKDKLDLEKQLVNRKVNDSIRLRQDVNDLQLAKFRTSSRHQALYYIEIQLQNNDFESTVDELYYLVEGPFLDEKLTKKGIQNLLLNNKNAKKLNFVYLDPLNPTSPKKNLYQKHDEISHLNEIKLNEIKRKFREIKSNIREIKDLLKELSEERKNLDVNFLLLSMFFMFVIGVIYPLGLMPIEQNELNIVISKELILKNLFTFKSLLLISILLAFSMVMLWIKRKLKSLSHDDNVYLKLNEYTDIDYYSELLLGLDNNSK